MVDPFNLPKNYPDVCGQHSKRNRKRKDVEEETSTPKKKKKDAWFLDEEEMPISERQRKMLLRDTLGVAQQSTKAPSETTSGKSSITKSIVVCDSVISECVLQTHPSQYPSQNIHIS